MVGFRYTRVVILCLSITFFSSAAKASSWTNLKKVVIGCLVFGALGVSGQPASSVLQPGQMPLMTSPPSGSEPLPNGLMMYVQQDCGQFYGPGPDDSANARHHPLDDLEDELRGDDLRLELIEDDGRATALRRQGRRLLTAETCNPNPMLVNLLAGNTTDLATLKKRAKAIAGVTHVETNERQYLTDEVPTVGSDPLTSEQWALANMKVADAWDYEPRCRADNVVLAIADTGINPDHEDLRDNILRDEQGKIVGYNLADDNDDITDYQGHGTHVAGVAMRSGNRAGGSGLSAGNCIKVMPLKVFSGAETTTDMMSVIKALRYADAYARQKNLHIILNLSLGGFGAASEIYRAEIRKALLFIVAAAGNEGREMVDFYPASYEEVLSVAAINQRNEPAAFSNYGIHVDVSAPGTDILSTYIGGRNRYALLSGTSMAAPQVAGVIAMTSDGKRLTTVQGLRPLLPRMTRQVASRRAFPARIDALAVVRVVSGYNDSSTPNAATSLSAHKALPMAMGALSMLLSYLLL